MVKQIDKVILEGKVRTALGSGVVNRMRKSGVIPGVVYGQGEKSVPIQVSQGDLSHLLHSKSGENLLITLQLADGKAAKPRETTVLLKTLQHHPVTHQITHVDFHHVSLTKRVTVTVDLEVKGEAEGVKQEGGVLEHIRWDLEVECLPTEIPEAIDLHLDALKLNESIHAKDIPLPEGVSLVTDPEQTIISCVVPKVEAEPEVAESEEGAGEPEVLKQKSPEEIAAEDADKKDKKDKKDKQDKQDKQEVQEKKEDK